MLTYKYYDKLYSKYDLFEEIEWHKFLNSFNKKEMDFWTMCWDIDFIFLVDQYLEYDVNYRVKLFFENYNK
jgi:hypothetical protein